MERFYSTELWSNGDGMHARTPIPGLGRGWETQTESKIVFDCKGINSFDVLGQEFERRFTAF
jgi:hypothetical protein